MTVTLNKKRVNFYNSLPIAYHGNEEAFWDYVVENKVIYILDYGKRQFYLWNSEDGFDDTKTEYYENQTVQKKRRKESQKEFEERTERFAANKANSRFKDAAPIALNTDEEIDRLVDMVGDNLLITEDAHLKPKTKRSKAQALSGEQIIRLVKGIRDNGGEVLCSGQDITTTFIGFFRDTYQKADEDKESLQARIAKTDEKDPIYMYHAILCRPVIMSSFSFPPDAECSNCELSQEEIQLGITRATKAFSKSQEFLKGEFWRKQTNQNLNTSRSDDYSRDKDLNTEWFLQHFEQIKGMLSPQTQKVFGFIYDSVYHSSQISKAKRDNPEHPMYFVHKGKDNEREEFCEFFSHVAVLSILGSLRDPTTGEWMLYDNNKMPSNNFMKRQVFTFRPKRKHSGTIASNLKYHAFPKIASDYCINLGTPIKKGKVKINTFSMNTQTRSNFKTILKQFKHSCIELYGVIRKIALEEVNDGANYRLVFKSDN